VLRRAWRILVLLGVVGVANFNTFVYLGLQSTTATNAVLIVSTTPVIIVALSRLILAEPVGGHQAMGILISLAGVLTIITRGEPRALLALDLSAGDLWILAAVVSWALYSVLLKWRPPDLHPLGFLGATVVVGVVVLTPLYAWEALRGPSVRFDAVTVGSVLYVALFASVLAYIFWNRAVGEVGANRAGQFIHLMPAFGTLLSMLFLGEIVRGFHLLGIALIFSGIYLTTVWRPVGRPRPG
jgi:drug/metabolite transporter (DMT)-like permease